MSNCANNTAVADMSALVSNLRTDAGLLHDVVHSEELEIDVETGKRKTLAGLENYLTTELDTQIDQALSDVNEAVNQSQANVDQAEAAANAALASAEEAAESAASIDVEAFEEQIDDLALDLHNHKQNETPHPNAGYLTKNDLPNYFPIGGLMHFAASTPPNGFLHCAGGAISRTNYADLFAVIGTKYGAGDGATTFNLPNFADGEALLAGAAASVGVVTVGQVIAHTHQIGYVQYKYTGNEHTMNILNANGAYKDTTSTGGSKNLAAGVKTLICIRYK